MLVAIAGLPASGKTTVCEQLEKQGFRGLHRDEFILKLFKPADFSSREQKDTAFKVMLMVALYYLQKGEKVALDCPSFSQEWAVKSAAFVANRAKVRLKMIYCDCPEDVAIARIKAITDHIATDRTPILYREVKARWQPIRIPHKMINTDRPIEQTMRDVDDFLNS
ncbi:MAG: AAA family ATPase [Patescibacteria group bacterium]|nr:AAA family ATPase [Patescibacteria group bacterium]MDD5715783.1 AAA family ATPase [Patescibacteria group bacterium]